MLNWPTLKQYDKSHLSRIRLPLGGIGTGTISLGGRGQLLDWEIHNQPAKNTEIKPYGGNSFFTLYAKSEGGEPIMRVLEGSLEPSTYEGSHGSKAAFHGLPRFRECRFETAYPLAQVMLNDQDVPISVVLQAFNPLIPADADRSGIPVAVLRYVLTNKTNHQVSATLCGTMKNLCQGEEKRNERFDRDSLIGLFYTGKNGYEFDRGVGTMAISVIGGEVSTRSEWETGMWNTPLKNFWEDLQADGKLDESQGVKDSQNLYGSLASTVSLQAKETVSVTFLITWHFPNRYNWYPSENLNNEGVSHLNSADLVGNYYTTCYKDALDVALQTSKNLEELERETVLFIDALCKSDLPETVVEAALFNVSTLRTETCFRTSDGFLYGWEGCFDTKGCCAGSCTHVWNYETTVPFLFGNLACGMRRVEFKYATNPLSGGMSFRVNLPLSTEKGEGVAAADGQMGCIMKIYREWKLSGDMDFLVELWPQIRKSLEFCWIPGGWDADQDGVMEGCQHNTMDVEYYGPNPQMGFWYLGALRAAQEMAKAVNEPQFSEHCRLLFNKGSSYMDDHLFNGEYYEHKIVPIKSWDDIAKGLNMKMGAEDPANPRFQLGSGCLVDQLVGQYMAHICGLGYLTKKSNIEKTLQSIMKYNYKSQLFDHFNFMRSYALNDESALLMASYPHGDRPEEPFPYYSEVMTGFEYTAATHMLYEGQMEDGLKCIQSIRKRYDGLRRNPFDEAECGHHYVRAMAAWSGILALNGFAYNGVDECVNLVKREGVTFWSTGYAYGTCDVKNKLLFSVLGGSIRIRTLYLDGKEIYALPRTKIIKNGESLELSLNENLKNT